MSTSFQKAEINKKLILAIGVLAVVLILGGAYFFFGSSGKESTGDTSSQSGINANNIEAEYSIATRSSEQRNEMLFSEGDNKTINNQNIKLVKVGLSSAIIKIGNETKVMGSGKDYSFGNLSVRVLSTTFSDEAKNRKAIVRINRIDLPIDQNLSRNFGSEFTLAEGESAKEGGLEITLNLISREGISIVAGQENKSLLVGDWLDTSGYRIRIKDIFYNGEPSDSRVVILVGNFASK